MEEWGQETGRPKGVLQAPQGLWLKASASRPNQGKRLLRGGWLGPETSALETVIRALAFYWKTRVISTPENIRRPNKFYHCIIVWKYNMDLSWILMSSFKQLHSLIKQRS